jgi:alanine-synthesizing transaminase
MSTTDLLQQREILPSARLENVRYAIRDLAVLSDELVRAGKKILHLNIGDPLLFDFQTPPHLVEAVIKAIRDGKNGYADSLGEDEALLAICGEAERKGIRNIQSVFVTSGVSEAVDDCLAALLSPGDTVLTPVPDYPLYTATLNKLGAPISPYYLDEENGWQPDVEELASLITPQTRGLVVINPNNPTGALYSRETLLEILDLARRHNLVIFADEIYDKLVWGERPFIPIASLASDVPVITFGGLSKSFLAPGWRIGWVIASGPASVMPYVEGICKLLRARLCASRPMQYAVKPALEGPQDHLVTVHAKLRSRGEITRRWAQQTPRVSCSDPAAAFYAYPKLEIPDDDFTFVKKVLAESQVLLVHGAGFGQKPGTKHVRIVFLPDENTLTTAYARISEFMGEHYR